MSEDTPESSEEQVHEEPPPPDPNDPLGLVEAEPALARFRKNPTIDAAIKAGDTKALRAELDRERDRHPDIPKILKNRRLFLEPIKSAPTMQTVNGIGTTLYTSDPAPDGTKIGTLWFTFVFVPLVPFAQYLVYPQPDGSFLFLGKVPMGGVTRLWRRYRSAP